MLYTFDTTAAQRIAIENALGGVFADIERAHRMLRALCDEYGSESDRPKHASEWQDVSDRLSLIADALYGAIFDYKLTVAEDETVEQFCEIAKRAQTAKGVHDTRSAIRRKYRNRQEPEKVTSTARDAFSLPDEKALPMLQAIAEGAAGKENAGNG